VVCALGPNAPAYNPAADQRPAPDAMELASRVSTALKTICATNCPEVAVFRNTSAANAMLIANSGQAKLVYAPQFFSAAYDSFGDGAIVAIIAHEMGHALDDVIGAAWVKPNWPAESRADAWAGCALARAELSASDLTGAFAALEKYPSPAHPAWNLRLPVLRTGYTQCGGDGSRFDAAVKHR
jgi:hypothetical protein